MGSGNELYEVEKFDGENFSFWTMQMEDYLHQKELYMPLVEKPKGVSDVDWMVWRMPKGMTEEKWLVLNRKAVGEIWLSLSKSVALNIKGRRQLQIS